MVDPWGQGSLRGGSRGNAVPIVKVFKDALWTALRTIFRPKSTTAGFCIYNLKIFPG